MRNNQEVDRSGETETSPLVNRTKSRRHKNYTNATRNRAKLSALKAQKSARLVYQNPASLNFHRNNTITETDNLENKKPLPTPTHTDTAKKVIESWVERGQNPSLRQQISFYVDTSRLGRFWDLFDFLVNLLLVCIYFWNTRYVKEENSEQLLPREYFLIEWSLALLLFVQWIPRVYISPDMFDSLTTSFSLVSLAATVPPIMVPLLDHFSTTIDFSKTYMAAGPFVYIYPLRFIRLHMSFTTLLLPVKRAFFQLSVIEKKTLKLCSTILFNLCFVSAWVHIVTYKLHESDEEVRYISFFDAFFFTTISFTSGFNSNLVPDNVINRVLILYVMISAALFLPGKINELLELISKRSRYNRPFDLERNQQHVIICGNFDNNCLFEFLREFFCEDHGLQTMNTNVVILNPAEPSEDLKYILNDPAYLNRVQYVKGLPTSYKSLQKVSAQKAKACFVLTNKFTSLDDRESDANAVMLALAIKRFSKSMKIYAKVNLPENKPHFDQLARRIICIQELRMGLLAQNVLNPGFSTIIFHLATSMTTATSEELSSSISSKADLEWLGEYIHSASHEIYCIKFSKCFIGMKFISAAQHIYRYFGATLFAVNIPLSVERRNSKKKNILLNPAFYTIEGGETGYIMSSSAYDANRISTLGEDGNSFDEYSCIFNEDLDALADTRHLTDEHENVHISYSYGSKSDRKHSTKESKHNGLIERVNKRLVLQSDESSDEDQLDETQRIKLSDLPIELNAFGDFAGNTLTESLSLQERNINKVISDMMQENSYFEALSAVDKISGHVVICDFSSSFPPSMEYFVGSLRASHLQEHLPIVVLSVATPSDSQRYVLEQFGEVYFLQGSPLSRKALFSAGVSRARKGIVLCDGNACSESAERTVDASSLLVVLNMESMALDPDFFAVFEFIYRENMRLVGAGETIIVSESYAQTLLRPAFMAGHVIAPCMLEPFICQAYYNDDFLAVIDRLIFDSSLDKWRRVGGSGEGGAPTPVQDIHSQTGVSKAHIFTFVVPSIFIGRSFFHLFSWLLNEKRAIPLGIYRTRVFKGKHLSYVIANPKPDEVLLTLDKVYIVSEDMP